MRRVLIVDDDGPVCELLAMYLRDDGFSVATAGTGTEALAAVDKEAPTLVLLDLLLPDMAGEEVCRRLQEGRTHTPVVLVSCKSGAEERIAGLELGADDYITKPFNPREVVARVKAVLRRGHSWRCGETPVLRAGELEMCEQTREVRVDGTPLRLTATEFGILWLLASQPRVVMPRQRIREEALRSSATVRDRTIDTHIRHLRSKLRGAGGRRLRIESVWGIGYRLLTLA
jgi:two-component system, OmpR family, response regulator